jgi:hypothetical protein
MLHLLDNKTKVLRPMLPCQFTTVAYGRHVALGLKHLRGNYHESSSAISASKLRIKVLMLLSIMMLLLLQTGLEQLRQFAATMQPGVAAR